MKASVTIDWADVPGYFDAFYPSTAGQVQNIDYAPSSMAIFTDIYHTNDISVEVDILPLLKIWHTHDTFKCDFVRSITNMDGPGRVVEATAEEQAYLKADRTLLQSLIRHKNEQWLDDISNGKVVKILVSPIGMEPEPEVLLFVLHDEESRHLQEKGDEGFDADEDWRYLDKVQMDGLEEVEFDFPQICPQGRRVEAL